MHVWDGSLFGTWSSVDVTATPCHSKMLVPVTSYTWTRALGIHSDKIWRLSHKYFAYYMNFWLFFSFYVFNSVFTVSRDGILEFLRSAFKYSFYLSCLLEKGTLVS